MESKKLGMILIIISLIVGGLFVYFSINLSQKSQELGCYINPDCLPVEKSLSASHFAIGIFSFILSLGFYLLFFSKTEEKIMKRLEYEKEKDKFEFALKLLDPFEREVLEKVKEQDGITQNTLRIRTNMSKTKLSYVLQDLEKRGLVKRVKKGKTLAVWANI